MSDIAFGIGTADTSRLATIPPLIKQGKNHRTCAISTVRTSSRLAKKKWQAGECVYVYNFESHKLKYYSNKYYVF